MRKKIEKFMLKYNNIRQAKKNSFKKKNDHGSSNTV